MDHKRASPGIGTVAPWNLAAWTLSENGLSWDLCCVVLAAIYFCIVGLHDLRIHWYVLQARSPRITTTSAYAGSAEEDILYASVPLLSCGEV